MDRKHYNRLLKLADFLEKLPNRKFYLGSWIGGNWDEGDDEAHGDLNRCGTTACALGWATMLPFAKTEKVRLCPDQTKGTFMIGKNYVEPEHAARKLFGVSYTEFTELFYPSGLADGLYTITPKDYAKELRTWVSVRMPAKGAN